MGRNRQNQENRFILGELKCPKNIQKPGTERTGLNHEIQLQQQNAITGFHQADSLRTILSGDSGCN